MKMRIAGIETFSMVNGEGCRFVIFTQGCAHHCKQCHNPETWDFNGGTEIDTDDLAQQISAKLKKHPLDGITLSGGDPFYQQDACCDLLKKLPKGTNVWCYTGFRYEDIKNTELAQLCDTIVDGEFVASQKCDGKMYGSNNQRIIRKGQVVG